MAQVTLKGNVVNTNGNLPAVGSKAPDFVLTKVDLSALSSLELEGKKVILNIFPSLDTGTCAASVRRFNADAAHLNNTVVLCISQDLPFAHKRFCVSEGIENVVNLSTFRNHEFLESYGVQIIDGPMTGLCARAVAVLNEEGIVIHTELVSEITQEPDYRAALAVLT